MTVLWIQMQIHPALYDVCALGVPSALLWLQEICTKLLFELVLHCTGCLTHMVVLSGC